jgi:hypothetical protein
MKWKCDIIQNVCKIDPVRTGLRVIVHTNQSQNIGATYINLLLVYGSDENIEKNIRKVKKKWKLF